MTSVRQRVAALIRRDGRLLVVRQRARGPSGRHDGASYLTPPGGGVEPGESWPDAVDREIREEVGLTVSSAHLKSCVDHTGGSTAVYEVTVDPGEPVLGVDPDLECDCPRMVGLEWVAAPPPDVWWGAAARAALATAGRSAGIADGTATL